MHRTRIDLQSVGSPSRTELAETALALCHRAQRVSDVTAVLARLVQRSPAALHRVAELARTRPGPHRRNEILAAAADVSGGAHSVLERDYLVDVE